MPKFIWINGSNNDYGIVLFPFTLTNNYKNYSFNFGGPGTSHYAFKNDTYAKILNNVVYWYVPATFEYNPVWQANVQGQKYYYYAMG